MSIDAGNEQVRGQGWVRVKAAGGELNDGLDLFQRDVELLDDLVDAGSGLEVLEHGGDGHESVLEDPRAAQSAGYAFYGGALRPIEHCHVPRIVLGRSRVAGTLRRPTMETVIIVEKAEHPTADQLRRTPRPRIETWGTRHFLTSQVNKVNPRKEFFRVSVATIREELERLNIKTQWTMTASAKEYRETLALERTLEEDPEKGYELLEQIADTTTTSSNSESEEEEAGTLV